jgi:hypothetical protein
MLRNIIILLLVIVTGGCESVARNPDDDATVVTDCFETCFGFQIRTLREYDLEPYKSVSDADFVCSFNYGEINGYFYIRTTPISCGTEEVCHYETAGAWVSINGVVEVVEDATYNWGGQHHNDSIRLKYDGLTYRFYHSSFGFGWRACQPPDCLQIENDDALVQDGCYPVRSLPIVCRLVNFDGTFDPLVDDFETCPGDTPGQADAVPVTRPTWSGLSRCRSR